MGKKRTEAWMQLPKLNNGKWTGEWSRAVAPYATPTMASLRQPARYYVISDAQLKRDLQGRTLADVYRENRAHRTPEGRYKPKHQVVGFCRRKREYRLVTYGGCEHDSFGATRPSITDEYLAWCKERGHTPHPASIDSDHPMHAGQRERCPKREICA